MARVSDISKSFGSTHALSNVSVDFMPGTVHTLLGENGSGKSTLVKVLSGVLRPDGGTVNVGNAEWASYSPQRARRAGVATVFQEILIAPNISVFDNTILGQQGWIRRLISQREARAKAAEVLGRLTERSVNLDESAGSLSIVRQHQIAIARAVLTEPKILVLDESTAALDMRDRDRLFVLCQDLTDRGTALVFVSHRMDEVLDISTDISVLRSGHKIGSYKRSEVTKDMLLSLLDRSGASA